MTNMPRSYRPNPAYFAVILFGSVGILRVPEANSTPIRLICGTTQNEAPAATEPDILRTKSSVDASVVLGWYNEVIEATSSKMFPYQTLTRGIPRKASPTPD